MVDAARVRGLELLTYRVTSTKEIISAVDAAHTAGAAGVSRDENEAVKAGRMPQAWNRKPAKLSQKDRDARWTQKHGKSFFGYKNHVNADAKHKLIRRYEVTDAAVHDSRPLEELLTKGNTSADERDASFFLWAPSRRPTINGEAQGCGTRDGATSAAAAVRSRRRTYMTSALAIAATATASCAPTASHVGLIPSASSQSGTVNTS